MCYRLIEKQSRARKESIESNLTTIGSTEEVAASTETVASRNQSAERAFSRFMSSLRRLLASRKQKQEEPIS